MSISLTDVNDNAPYFPHGQYHVSVVENNNIGDVITQLKASDADIGENARISYRLASASENFEINKDSGEITALVSLDAEKNLHEPEMLEIIAEDNGNPKLRGQTTLRVSIKDFNDNAPIFIRKNYTFEITENLPTSFIIGQVEAIDGDLVPDLKYKLLQNYKYFPFEIDQENGRLYVAGKVDYEGDNQLYDFQVQAIDKDGFNDLANVKIQILDENDNPPRVKYPHPSKDVIWLPPTLQPGDLVTTIQVVDPDSGANGNTDFEIEGGSGSDFVKINHIGEIILQKEIKPKDYGRYAIFVRINDHGKNQLFTTLRVRLD